SSRRRHTRFSRDWSSDVCSFRSWEGARGLTSTGSLTTSSKRTPDSPAFWARESTSMGSTFPEFSSFSSFTWEKPVWTTVRARNKRSSFLPTGQQFFYSSELLFRMEGDHDLALSLGGGADVDLGGQMVLDGPQPLGREVRKLLLPFFSFGSGPGGGFLEGLDQFLGLPH